MEVPRSLLELKKQLEQKEKNNKQSTRVDAKQWTKHEQWLIQQITRGVIRRKPRRKPLGEKTVLDYLSDSEIDVLMRKFHSPAKKCRA